MSSSQENHNKVEKKKRFYFFHQNIIDSSSNEWILFFVKTAMSAIQNVHLTKRCLHKRKGPMCLII